MFPAPKWSLKSSQRIPRDFFDGDLRSGSTTDGGARLFLSTMHGQGTSGQSDILVVDISARRWSRLTSLPVHQYAYCLEWHGGRLYVAGGIALSTNEPLNSLHAFNEATGLWEDLPPMPYAPMCAASGVIGNQLFIAGGMLRCTDKTLQIYDIATRTWRLGAPLPQRSSTAHHIVLDGKLHLIELIFTLVYDPQSDTWTEETVPPSFEYLVHACAHDGRILAFLDNGTVLARATDGSWSPYEVVETAPGPDFAIQSVLLG